MKRDMDLVRSILMQVELADGPLDSAKITHDGHSDQELLWHIDLLANHDLIDARVQRAYGSERIGAVIDGLTWDGLDMLDSMRSAVVWQRAKDAVKGSVGSTTLDVFKTVCCKVATDMIMQSISL